MDNHATSTISILCLCHLSFPSIEYIISKHIFRWRSRNDEESQHQYRNVEISNVTGNCNENVATIATSTSNEHDNYMELQTRNIMESYYSALPCESNRTDHATYKNVRISDANRHYYSNMTVRNKVLKLELNAKSNVNENSQA